MPSVDEARQVFEVHAMHVHFIEMFNPAALPARHWKPVRQFDAKTARTWE